jgi:Zn-dependent alcohol dehydrogenase
LITFARDSKLDLARAVTACIPLEAAAINQALDRLEQFGDEVRTVIQP